MEDGRRGDRARAGEALRAARRGMGMTAPQMAQKLGVSVQAVKKWEAGERMPRSAEVASAIAEILGVPVETLELLPPDFSSATLATIRRSRRVPIRDFAEMIGTDQRVVRQVEAGIRLPPDEEKWRKALDISVRQMADAWRRTQPPD